MSTQRHILAVLALVLASSTPLVSPARSGEVWVRPDVNMVTGRASPSRASDGATAAGAAAAAVVGHGGSASTFRWPPSVGTVGLEGVWQRSVRAVAVFDEGTGPALFAKGKFAGVNDVTVNIIARWDGSAWSALGSVAGVDGYGATL